MTNLTLNKLCQDTPCLIRFPAAQENRQKYGGGKVQVKRTEVRRKVEGEEWKVGQESFTLRSEQVSGSTAHENTFQPLNSHVVFVRGEEREEKCTLLQQATIHLFPVYSAVELQRCCFAIVLCKIVFSHSHGHKKFLTWHSAGTKLSQRVGELCALPWPARIHKPVALLMLCV